MIRIITAILSFILTMSIQNVPAQSAMVKTNAIYAGATLTPNIGVEIRLGDKSTLDIGGGYNPWYLKGSMDSNKKFVHWISQAEFRYWLCQSFDRHFLGVHLLASEYNISQKKLDFIFGADSQKYRFQGYGLGAGISYGYQWLLSRNWSLEANLGIGAVFMDYDKYECRQCGEHENSVQMVHVGLTRLGINIIYFIK